MNDNGTIDDTIPAVEDTIQSITRREDQLPSLDILPLLITGNEILPPYWSRARDRELDHLWRMSDHISSAFSMFIAKTASVPLQVEPRDITIKRHVKEADALNTMLHSLTDFGKGWTVSLAPHLILSYISQDNGCFAEVIGDGGPLRDPHTGRIIAPIDTSKPRKGLPISIAHLDPMRCMRTSNPVYPILYTDTDGSIYKLHHTRVMYASSMPSTRALMHNVGFCALSRMAAVTQNLIDIATYEQEKLGSRPPRQMIVTESGITAAEVATAMMTAYSDMDNQSLHRFAKTVIIGRKTAATAQNPIKLNLLDLASVPDGFDKETSITLGMFLISLALNVPPRWLWPATQAGATKADAMFQHTAGLGGGIGHLLEVFISMLGGDESADILNKPVPSRFKVVFDFQDDIQDQNAAEIEKVRSETRERDLLNGSIDIRTAREWMLKQADITEAQFNRMELEDGRLPDGSNILNLFMTSDQELQTMLMIPVGDVLNVQANMDNREFVLSEIDEKILEVRAVIANPPRPKMFDKARMAIKALEALKGLYTAVPATGEVTEVQTETGRRLALSPLQIQSALSVVRSVQTGEITRQSGLATLELMFGLSNEDAERLLSEIEQAELEEE